LLGSSAREAVKIEPESVKLKISSVRSHCQGMTGEDRVGWKRLRGCCNDLLNVEISGGAVIACSSEVCV
jgi:hypothetical protein